jgi:hypothetical protein
MNRQTTITKFRSALFAREESHEETREKRRRFASVTQADRMGNSRASRAPCTHDDIRKAVFKVG